jgi:hypothetical protein
MAYEQTVDSVALSGHLADALAARYSPDGSCIVTAGAAVVVYASVILDLLHAGVIFSRASL